MENIKRLIEQMDEIVNKYIGIIKPIEIKTIENFLEYGSQKYRITNNGGEELCVLLMKYEDENECSYEELKMIRDIELNGRLRIYQQFE